MSVLEIITDRGRRPHWGPVEKLGVVERALDGRGGVSVVMRRDGLLPIHHAVRQLMLEARSTATMM